MHTRTWLGEGHTFENGDANAAAAAVHSQLSTGANKAATHIPWQVCIDR